MNPLEKTITEMKQMAAMLIPHTWPQAELEDEQAVLCLKQRQVTVDGYQVILGFSRADYGKYFLDSLQIQSYHAPFLPFSIVCKLGKMFYGRNVLLAYVDFFRNDKKVYCWAVKYRDGQPLPPTKRSVEAEFEGFEYRILHTGTAELY